MIFKRINISCHARYIAIITYPIGKCQRGSYQRKKITNKKRVEKEVVH